MSYQIGDILQGKRRGPDEAYHYIVYLGESMSRAFTGVILTTSSRWRNNMPLPDNFFKMRDENGKLYKVQYNNSHFMQVRLDKPNEWGPYKKVGEITAEGVVYIESNLNSIRAITYREYEARIGLLNNE